MEEVGSLYSHCHYLFCGHSIHVLSCCLLVSMLELVNKVEGKFGTGDGGMAC